MKNTVLFLFWVAPHLIFATYSTDSILSALEIEILQRDKYVQQRLAKIEGYQQIYRTTPDLEKKYNACFSIYNEYKSFIYDSAFHYAMNLTRLAHERKNPVVIQSAKVKTAFILVSGGLYKEAYDTLQSVTIDQMPDSVKRDFYSVSARLYNDMALYVQDAYYARLYQAKGNEYVQKELALNLVDSYDYNSLLIRAKQSENDLETARELYRKLKGNFELTAHQQAMEAYNISTTYREDDIERDIYFKALAAIYDIRAAVKETVSIRELAALLYQSGDITRASVCIKEALDEANFYSSRLRKMQVSAILPIIESRQYQELENRKDKITIYSSIITILVLVLFSFLFIIIKQLRKLKVSQRNLDSANASLYNANLKLEESNKIKEAYIGQFFNAISEYLFKIEKIVNLINRKLSQRKFDDLTDITQDINSFKERELLFKDFDEMFLDLFPDFIPKLNCYLKEEEKLDEHMKLLTPEIRIFALMRLGIADNNKIARFLNYSINTIYTYKTRLKNKAKVPETFEETIIEIA